MAKCHIQVAQGVALTRWRCTEHKSHAWLLGYHVPDRELAEAIQQHVDAHASATPSKGQDCYGPSEED